MRLRSVNFRRLFHFDILHGLVFWISRVPRGLRGNSICHRQVEMALCSSSDSTKRYQVSSLESRYKKGVIFGIRYIFVNVAIISVLFSRACDELTSCERVCKAQPCTKFWHSENKDCKEWCHFYSLSRLVIIMVL